MRTFTDEHRRKLSEARKSWHYTDEQKAAISAKSKARGPNKGTFRKGHVMTADARERMRATLVAIGHHPPQVRGKEHPRWKDGRSSNRKYLGFIKNKRNRMKRSCEGSHTFEEWEALKERTGNKCLSCLRSGDVVQLTEDHIVPISKRGSDYISNIQPLCQSCNSSKSATIKNYLFH